MSGKRAGLVFLLAQLLALLSSKAQDQITVDAGVVVVTNARRQGINENYLMDSERERLTTPARTTAAALQEMAPSFMRYPVDPAVDELATDARPDRAGLLAGGLDRVLCSPGRDVDSEQGAVDVR
jgi:hypothetical protein